MSKGFPSGATSVAFGRYRITPVPSLNTDRVEAVLDFTDSYEAPLGGGSNPEEEANIICNLLSLICEARIKRSGLRVGAVDVPLSQDRVYARYRGTLPEIDTNDYLEHVLSLSRDLARQVSRACRAYSAALDFIPADPTFAFFLLVVSIECLSSQQAIIPSEELDVDKKKCERFCTFIERHVKQALPSVEQRASPALRELLKTVYYAHRSAFVHGGKEVSSATVMADRIGAAYFKHATDGPEVRTPGLDWFAGIAREAILGYIVSLPKTDAPNVDLIAEIAFEKAALRIRVKRDVRAGEVVTFGDIDYE